MSGSVFSDTLQEITNAKLDEISKRRTAFEEAKSLTLSSIQSQSDPLQRLALLSNGVKKCFAIKVDKEGRVILEQARHYRLEVQLRNLDRFLAQARHDPSVSTRTIGDWERDLLGHLETQSLRYQYASLYGQLVTEWLSKPSVEKQGAEAGSGDGDGDVEVGGAFEDVGTAAKLKSRSEWDSTVFEPAKVDVDTLIGYLDSLFGRGGDSPETETDRRKRHVLHRLREEIQDFEIELSRPEPFTQSTLEWAIRGLLSSDLLTNEEREVLRDFRGNAIILSEIADVLNMRFSAIESWNWSPDGVPVEQRRKINGIFSIHMHEDLLQAIFLQYIGVKWSVFFRRAFTAVRDYKEAAWTPFDREIPDLEKRRLEYYLGPLSTRRSLQKERQATYNRDYFVARLLRKAGEVIDRADGEVEADYSTHQAGIAKKKKGLGKGGALRHRKVTYSTRASVSNDDDDSSDEDDHQQGARFLCADVEEEPPLNPTQLKQRLLHLLSTEIAVNTRLHGGISAFHAVFRDWDTRLPHETITTVLGFFGVSSTWVEFFNRYLQAPLRFPEDSDTSQPPKVRRRGVPSSHTLSDVLGETVLFCLDLAVNQAASGQPLWRLGDDIWFWSADHQTSVKAWTAVEQFASVTATSINNEKSGSVRISRDQGSDTQAGEILPQGEIRWGFLVLSLETGRFEIDQTMVDSHIAELGQQLRDKKHSVFDFIQTWNTYAATFLSSNFGESANCFGRNHVDDMLATHRRIQQEIFSEDSVGGLGPASSILDYLKKVIEQRFGVTDVPDGFFYFPVDLGGLDLQSPFISLLQIRDSVLQSHDGLFEAMFEAEREAYDRFKALFDSGSTKVAQGNAPDPSQKQNSRQGRGDFFSFEEFVRYREDIHILSNDSNPKDVAWVYAQLMAKPAQQRVIADRYSEVWTSLSRLKPGNGAITNQWLSMSPYWAWVTVMYGPEIVKLFGDLSMVDAGLLPMGMVGLFREKRVTWKD
ncbi:hypothetical protein VPNG_09321 [Cytospora leucostoma]|uniref:Reverse transcriptase domain-containing protein n=1 Tax=Cytospora leucostoma TaxID=1230097 RepID=A0A423VV09_9PEZI|nr:hypothetical protein VPNG_09321 [Cytospora leucostoma]